MNTFIDIVKTYTDLDYTENGALTHSTTHSAVFDLFSFGGSYRSRSDSECITLFKKALKEDESLAMKCLFYLRDVRGGQGERNHDTRHTGYAGSAEPEERGRRQSGD